METNFLFLGPELGEKQDAVNDIRAKLKGAGAPAEETSFYAGETAMQDIVSVLRNGSLFSDTRLIFIRNAENIKKKEEIDALTAYIVDPADNTTLILLSNENGVVKPIEHAISPNGKRIFWELFENRKHEWLVHFFRKEGFSITEEGIEAVLELVENNTDSLRRECFRLCRFIDSSGKEKTITAEDAEKWLSHTREESAFTLFSRIAQGDLAKSLESLHSLLLAKETPSAILAGLTWCFQKLHDYLFLKEERSVDDTELRKIGLASPKARKDYEYAACRYDTWSADTCLSLTAEYNVRLRSAGQGLENLLMDRYVYKVWDAGQSGPKRA
ncbi:MAG: DNA polymerase III subunit delta [Treponema sp.]|jgi:DNA polymerase-3 subunit delta|nr:DNA polymerase III subunit delta [Treponema sp.]